MPAKPVTQNHPNPCVRGDPTVAINLRKLSSTLTTTYAVVTPPNILVVHQDADKTENANLSANPCSKSGLNSKNRIFA